MTSNPVVLTLVEWLALVSFLGLCIAVIKILMNRGVKLSDQRIGKSEDDIKGLWSKVGEITTNHHNRFEDLKNCILMSKMEMLNAISEVRIDLAKNYVTKSDCKTTSERELSEREKGDNS